MPFLALDRIQTNKAHKTPEPHAQGRTGSRQQPSDGRCQKKDRTARSRRPSATWPLQMLRLAFNPRDLPGTASPRPQTSLVGLTSSPCQRTRRQTSDDRRQMTVPRPQKIHQPMPQTRRRQPTSLDIAVAPLAPALDRPHPLLVSRQRPASLIRCASRASARQARWWS